MITFPDDKEGEVLQPWRMVIITIATLWETRNSPNSALLWNWVQGLQLNKVLKSAFLVPQRPGGHYRTPCNRPAGPACPVDLSPRPAPQTPEPWGEPRSLCRQEPPAELGAAGAQGEPGAPGAMRKLPFQARLPRGAFQWLCSEPLISAPAPVSILPFLGGDFNQSSLHWCRFMLRLMAGNLSMLWYVFRFWVVSGEKD